MRKVKRADRRTLRLFKSLGIAHNRQYLFSKADLSRITCSKRRRPATDEQK